MSCRGTEIPRQRMGITNDYSRRLSTPPSLAACPAARCADDDRPHPGRPRSGCAAGPLAPPGSHGACTSAWAAMGANRARLHHGSGSPPRGLPPHVRVQPRGLRPWPIATLSGAMSAVHRSRPAARTLRTAVRGAPRLGSSARTRAAGQDWRRRKTRLQRTCASRPCSLTAGSRAIPSSRNPLRAR